MSKKDKIKTIEVDDVNLVPELLDGNHRVIPIVTGGDEPVEEVEVPEIIPILTLRSSVLFPGAITPITVGRDKSINLVRAVNAEGGILGAVLQRESDVEDPAPDDMYKVGTAARIIKILEMPNGNLTVILNGLEKVEITEYITTEPYFKARVTALRDSTPDVKSIEFEALVDSIRDVALNIINVSPSMPKEAAFAIKNIDSKRGIINFICSNMELTDEDRQSLLEAPGLLARARKLLEILHIDQLIKGLSGIIKDTPYIIELQNKLSEKKELTEHRYVSNISCTDKKGKTVNWNSVKGKYVLLDFWASWNKESIATQDSLVSVQKALKKDKFVIISLSLDLDKKEWMEKIIQRDTTQWKQVCDFKGWNNSIVKQQGITRIPANILIGPDKRVITQDIRGKELIDKVRQLTEQDKEKEKAAKEAERARKRQNKK